MKKYLFTFLFGLILGSSGYWLCRDGPLAEKIMKSSVVTKTGEALEHRANERAASEVLKD